MKTGILIIARLGSTRLKKKHLLPINGKPVISYLLNRIRQEFEAEIGNRQVELIITTSDEPENREFESLTGQGVHVFYGSLNNIPLRHLQTVKHFELDNVISVDGDDILCSTNGMRQVYNALNGGKEYVKTSGLPFGLNSFGYNKDFLEDSLAEHTADILETGWGRIFDPGKGYEIKIPFAVNNDLLRFSLDYEEDFLFFKEIIETLGDKVLAIDDIDLVNMVLANNLYKITEIIAKEYWVNFYKNINKEVQSNGAQ